jgi:hypothetical protein
LEFEMRHSLSLLAVACVLAACSNGPGPDATQPPPVAKPAAAPDTSKATDDAGVTRLTIYSGDYDALAREESARAGMPGYALVERPLHYTLKAGPNAVAATSVPPAMDVEAATLRALSPGVTLESQRYVAPLSGTADVIARVLGQRIVVEHTAGNAKQTDAGILLAASDGLTLALGDGRIKVIRDYDNFSMVDGSKLVPQQAELRWTVNANDAGDANFLLSYPMGGMAWRAEYLATLAKDAGAECKLALDGAALVVNRAGVGFGDARLTLVAGEPRRAPLQKGYQLRNQFAADSVAAAAPPMPATRQSGEYHAYELPGTIAISNGATERVPLFARREAIDCQRTYVVDAGAPQWPTPQPNIDPGYRGQTGPLPVTATVSISNVADAGLGQPLPAGRVRVFDGNDFLGESALPHTPAGADIRLAVGNAFDLRADRETTAFRVDRTGRTITESFAITLGNAKDTDTTIRVVEAMPRWSDWDITGSSVEPEKKDASHVEFDVPVAANSEVKLTYTVRYRWTEGVSP